MAIPVEQRSPEQQAQVENLRRQQETLMQEFIAFIDSPATQNSIAQRRQTNDGEGSLQRAQQALITGDFAVVGSSRSSSRSNASANGSDGTIVTVSRDELPANVNNRLDHPYYWAPFILIGNGL